MWHEARKQERKIRGMIVDYKKRAERRRDFYERTKADPTQFLQLHGRQCKIHLDPAVAQAADSPANMMPWQGQVDTVIDRFDGRAHLDHIPEYKSTDAERIPNDETWEDRQTNYERYRILVENDFLGVSEDKFLMQIYLEEQYGPIGHKAEDDKKKSSEKKAAIGYIYEDSTGPLASCSSHQQDDDKDSDSDIDLDVTVDVDALTNEQAAEMNEQSVKYGMVGTDFMSLMTSDKEEAETLRLAREAEEEKAMYSGRKSRRERRAFREKKLQGRKISPPSYAARQSPTYNPYRRSKSPSRSRSKSPVDAGKITYITSFGDASDESGSEQNKWRSTFVGAGVVTGTSSLVNLIPSKTKSGSVTKQQHKRNVSDQSTVASCANLPEATSRSHRRRERNGSATRSRSSSRSVSSSINRRTRKRSPHDYHRSTRNRRRTSSYRSRSRSLSRRRTRTRSPLPRSRTISRRRHTSTSSSSSGSRMKRRRRRSSSRLSSSRSKSPKYGRSRSGSRSRGSHRKSPMKRIRSRSKSSRSSDRVSVPSNPVITTSMIGNVRSASGTPAIPRYYGRRRDEKRDTSLSGVSSSDDDGDDEDGNSEAGDDAKKPSSSLTTKARNVAGKAVVGFKAQNKLTPQERLKRRMQAALNRHYKADKKAELRKIEKQEQERLDREEELRELAIRLRRKERERRHRQRDSDREERSSERSGRHHSGRSRSNSSSSSSGSGSKSSTRSQTRTRSKSPIAKSANRRRSKSGSHSPLVNY